MKPYYSDEWVTIYHGDCREILPDLPMVDLVLTDPPYGIDYHTNQAVKLDSEIMGDMNTSLRDSVLSQLDNIPMLVFGSRKAPPPNNTRMVLIWDTKGALGMGAIDLPWKPSWQEIYVMGKGFHGKREGAVLRFAPVQATTKCGRKHPNEKPVPLLKYLLMRCPAGGVLDPFMGVGSTLVAAKELNRNCIGIEIEAKYCEIAANRCRQMVMELKV